MDLKIILNRLYAARGVFDEALITSCIEYLEEILLSDVPSHKVAIFLTALHYSYLDEDTNFLIQACLLMKRHAVKLESTHHKLVDIVGTGGDGKNTFNASTSAALVCAAAGLKVCKHGNRASTSTSGSADFLRALRYNLDVEPSRALEDLDDYGFVFLNAPNYHKSLANVSAVRATLGFPTFFNFLGPLLNPADVACRVIGVASRCSGDRMARVLQSLKIYPSTVICGDEGLDEVSPEGITHVWEVSSAEIKTYTISPSDFGKQSSPLELVQSKSANENAAIFREIAKGRGPSAITNIIVMNAAFLLYQAQMVSTLAAGVALAEETIATGLVSKLLDKIQLSVI